MDTKKAPAGTEAKTEAGSIVSSRDAAAQNYDPVHLEDLYEAVNAELVLLTADAKTPCAPWKDTHPTFAAVSAHLASHGNIGIKTGVLSGFDVVDVDDPAAHPELVALADHTACVKTPRGLHLYFYHNARVLRNRVGILPGVDLRADGGYVVCPPSEIGGTAYTWHRPLSCATEWPSRLLDRLCPPAPAPAPERRTTPTGGASGDRYTRAAIDRAVENVRNAPEGQRNATLNIEAYSLAGLCDADTAQDALLQPALESGLSPAEATATIRSGITAGQAAPRTVPNKPRTLSWDRAIKDDSTRAVAPKTGAAPVDAPDEEDAPEVVFAEWWNAPRPPMPLFEHGPEPGSYGVLAGPGGLGKGWLTLDLSVALATGRPLGVLSLKPTRPLRVCLLSYEDRQHHIRYRAGCISERAGILPADTEQLGVAGQLSVIEAERQIVDGRITKYGQSVTRALRGYDVVFVDTLAKAAGIGDENSNAEATMLTRAFAEIARVSGCAVIAVHHTSKGAATSGLAHTNAASRGASAIVDNARWQLILSRRGDTGNSLRLDVSKNNYGRELHDVNIERTEAGPLREVTGEELGRQIEDLETTLVNLVTAQPGVLCKGHFQNCKDATLRAAIPDAPAGLIRKALEKAIASGEVALHDGTRNRRAVQLLVPPGWEPAEPEEAAQCA